MGIVGAARRVQDAGGLVVLAIRELVNTIIDNIFIVLPAFLWKDSPVYNRTGQSVCMYIHACVCCVCILSLDNIIYNTEVTSWILVFMANYVILGML